MTSDARTRPCSTNAPLHAPAHTAAHTPAHTHTTRCWWHPAEARWVCGTAPLVDVRDMLVVHTALLREFRLAPAAVTRVEVGDVARARVVDRHLTFVCELLHHHHSGEDELLWPRLRARLPLTAVSRVDAVESEHAAIERALQQVTDARLRWTREADASTRAELAAALRDLHALLQTHLDDEERTVLPLAAGVLTTSEWRELGEAAMAALPKSVLPLVFGMFAYEGDPAVLHTMLAEAPLVPRLLLPRVAPRVYARRAALVHGTRRP